MASLPESALRGERLKLFKILLILNVAAPENEKN